MMWCHAISRCVDNHLSIFLSHIPAFLGLSELDRLLREEDSSWNQSKKFIGTSLFNWFAFRVGKLWFNCLEHTHPPRRGRQIFKIAELEILNFYKWKLRSASSTILLLLLISNPMILFRQAGTAWDTRLHPQRLLNININNRILIEEQSRGGLYSVSLVEDDLSRALLTK